MKFSLMMSATLIALLSTHAAFAEPSLPDKCPSVEAIKQAGFNRIDVISDGRWTASYLRNKYDTNFDWTFGLYGRDDDKVKDKNEAHQKAMKKLQTLAFKAGPYFDGNGDTACLYIYDGDTHTGGTAITPPLKPPSKVAL